MTREIQELRNPDGSAAGLCWRCRRPLTENERDPESLWFMSAHEMNACTFAKGDRVAVTAGRFTEEPAIVSEMLDHYEVEVEFLNYSDGSRIFVFPSSRLVIS